MTARRAQKKGGAAISAPPLKIRDETGLLGPNLDQELLDFAAQRLRLLGEIARRFQHLLGGLAGRARRLGNPGDVARNLLGPSRGLLNVAADFLGRGALLLNRGRDGRGDLADFADRFTRDSLDGSSQSPKKVTQ